MTRRDVLATSVEGKARGSDFVIPIRIGWLTVAFWQGISGDNNRGPLRRFPRVAPLACRSFDTIRSIDANSVPVIL